MILKYTTIPERSDSASRNTPSTITQLCTIAVDRPGRRNSDFLADPKALDGDLAAKKRASSVP
jgi:hypothetical protein